MDTLQALLALLMAFGFSIFAGAAADGISASTKLQGAVWVASTAMCIALAFMAGGVLL